MKLSDLTLAHIHSKANGSSFLKGEDYYEDGAVVDFHMSQGEIDATVIGSYEYQVSISEKVKGACTCPYDRGGRCKHIVAVALHFLDDKSTGDIESFVESQDDQGPTIQEELSKRKKHQLVEFITATCKEYPFLEKKILKKKVITKPRSYQDYKKEIKSLFRQASRRHGYIQYGDEIDFTDYYALIDEAIHCKNYQTAKDISQVLVESIDKELGDIDDSNGYYQGERHEALAYFLLSAPHYSSKKELFDYFLKAATTSEFFQNEYIKAAQSLCETIDERKLRAESIAPQALTFKPENSIRDQHDTYTIYVSYCEALIHSEQVNAFLKLAEQSFCTDKAIALLYIKTLATHKTTELAVQSAYRFLELQQSTHRGLREIQELIIQWHLELQQEDRATAMQLKILLQYKTIDDYHQLKSLVDADERPAFFKTIVNESLGSTFLIDIYLLEGQKDNARKVIQHAKSSRIASKYEKHFIKDYPSFYFETYKDTLENDMKCTTDRKTYKQRANEVKRIMKIPGYKQQMIDFVQEAKQQYPKRRAMIEEFTKAGL